MRYAISGTATRTIEEATAIGATGGARSLLTGTATTALAGTFWLRGLFVNIAVTGGPVSFFDCLDGATKGADSGISKLDIHLVTASSTDASQIYNFKPPGIKFATNCCALALTEVIAAGDIGVWGYIE